MLVDGSADIFFRWPVNWNRQKVRNQTEFYSLSFILFLLWAYARPMEYGGLDTHFVDQLSVPVATSSLSPFQLIKKTTNQKVVKNLSSFLDFLMPSIEFLTLTLVGCLLYYAVSWLFSRKSAGLRPSIRSLQIISFSFTLFMFCIEQLFSASLNTEHVVIRTDNMLYSKEQLVETKREFCFWERGAEEEFFEKVSCSIKV